MIKLLQKQNGAVFMLWNGLPDSLKSPDLSFDCFKRQLKTFLFCVGRMVLLLRIS